MPTKNYAHMAPAERRHERDQRLEWIANHKKLQENPHLLWSARLNSERHAKRHTKHVRDLERLGVDGGARSTRRRGGNRDAVVKKGAMDIASALHETADSHGHVKGSNAVKTYLLLNQAKKLAKSPTVKRDIEEAIDDLPKAKLFSLHGGRTHRHRRSRSTRRR